MKTKIEKISLIIGLILLPLIYSICYLNGFWDPYNNLDKINVALINSDNCKTNCKGDELVNILKESNSFNFIETNEKDANKGLINKKYYAVIKIPKTFTKDLNNIKEKDRKNTEIIFTSNTKTSYIVSQLTTSAVKQINKEINGTINETITENLVKTIYKMPNEVKQISNGTKEIKDATEELKKGATTLNEGVTTLKNGTEKLTNNYKKFNDGTKNLNDGAKKLYESYKEFDTNLNKIYEGSTTLKEKTDNFNDLYNGLDELYNGALNLKNGIKTYNESQIQMLDYTDKAFKSLIAYCQISNECQNNQYLQGIYQIAISYETPVQGTTGIEKLKNGATDIEQGINNVTNGTKQINEQKDKLKELKSGINELNDYLDKLSKGSKQINDGIKNLKDGTKEISNNSEKINNGITKINNGTNNLSNGTEKLTNGTSILNDGVKNAKDKIDKNIEKAEKDSKKLEGLSTYSKNPVKIKEKNYGDVNEYGTFFSPYFMSLSIWIGGILILMGLYYDPDQRIKVLGRDSKNKKLRLIIYNVLGITQAIALAFILKSALHFEITSTPLYYLSSILISEAFLAIITFLFFNFKDIGKFLSIAFLVLQLASCGGTFPVETEPTLYKIMYPFMPMTYSVNLLRESLTIINNSMVKENIIILLLIFIAFTTLTIITEISKTKKSRN